MRRYRMPELQESPENMLFCSAEGYHPGTAGRPAEHGDKAHDRQFAKVVTRVGSPRIGDVVEGGQEDVHRGKKLRRGDPGPRIHPPDNRKPLRSGQIPNAIPLGHQEGRDCGQFDIRQRSGSERLLMNAGGTAWVAFLWIGSPWGFRWSRWSPKARRFGRPPASSEATLRSRKDQIACKEENRLTYLQLRSAG